MRPWRVTFHVTGLPYGTAEGIRRFHMKPAARGGRGWSDIGYHLVITNGNPGIQRQDGIDRSPEMAADGKVWLGRSFERRGAHVFGHNEDNIGVVWVGKSGELTHRQLVMGIITAVRLCRRYGIQPKDVRGHFEYDELKSCPGIDMRIFRAAVEAQL